MSALGQKQTCAVQLGMSALPPKADMCSATRHVRFVPIADISDLKKKPETPKFLANKADIEPMRLQCYKSYTADNTKFVRTR